MGIVRGSREVAVTMNAANQRPISAGALWAQYPPTLRNTISSWVMERPSRPVWPVRLADTVAVAEANAVLAGAWRAFAGAIETIDEMPDQATFVGVDAYKRSIMMVAKAIANGLEDEAVADASEFERRWLEGVYSSKAWKRWRRLRDELRGRARYRRDEYRDARRTSQSTPGYREQRRRRAALENAQKRRRYWLRELATSYNEAAQARAERRLVTIDRELDILLHPRTPLQRLIDQEESVALGLEDRDRIEDERDADDDRAAAE